MGERIFDQTVFIATDDTNQSTSSDYHYLSISGDTILIKTSRTITNSNDNGYKGEICYDTNYIYVCIADNTWKRCALNTW